jgi:hypothetical protein
MVDGPDRGFSSLHADIKKSFGPKPRAFVALDPKTIDVVGLNLARVGTEAVRIAK